MTDDSKLTYYDYWLTKEVWNADHAVNIISNYYVFSHLFDSCDNYDHVKDSFRNELTHKMSHNDAAYIFKKKTVGKTGYDEYCDWVEGKLDLYKSYVSPYEFIKWLHDKKYQIPYEFKKFIGISNENMKINDKQAQLIDKSICQAVAKTLWDIYPKMTIEEMRDHKAIQLYGGGAQYSIDTTLRRWLREVDPRELKTGPKKKDIE